MQIDEQLSARRKQLTKRMIFIKICFQVTLIATLINCAGALFSMKRLFLPFGLCSVQFSLERGLYLLSKGDTGGFAISLLLFVLLLALFVLAYFMSGRSVPWAWGITALLTVDFLVTSVLFFTRMSLALYLIDLFLHCFVIIQGFRATRTVRALEVLPEREIEGDPFEEFRNED